ncbi:serine/threonine-protein kinase [Microcoleus sp. LEGE 07076]|uniref:serine/threonine-protein kinase n=1 Tax=Microcoleus sp. LEGE 07076 TaxID=915322 RepID=UPI001D15B3B3|nr:serine/threonine-protein kinase [Microcoleus sp. LEGE 07076]
MVWTPGQRLNGDRYIIEDKLGEGGFGVTYLAQKAQNRQRVVIKTLKDELLSDPDFARYRDRFRDEAVKLSVCRHPNIVQIDNYFDHGNLPCIAMEYVAGEDLWKWVEKRGILSETEALNYIRKAGEAVIVVHEKGLLHRDIKPQNIMVRDNQDAVLIDFGLARGFIPDRTQQMTLGLTHGFAPPEQYGEIGRFAEYTDVYALAATLYYLLTSIPPTAAFLRALNHPLKPPFQMNPNISDGVNRAIIKGMEMDATKRPQSVQKWLAMLPQPINLISAKGVDYGKLDRLLASGEWQEADHETKNKMLEAAGRTEERWFRIPDIYRFPCEDLRTIDQLWVKYSNGRFGYSVQKRIYESLGGTREYDREIWEAFGDRVGWRVKKSWLFYRDDFKFNIKSPSGHLPAVKINSSFWVRVSMSGWIVFFVWFAWFQWNSSLIFPPLSALLGWVYVAVIFVFSVTSLAVIWDDFLRYGVSHDDLWALLSQVKS